MARDALFDLAVNRALTYLERLGGLSEPRDVQRAQLAPWYLKTRFAYRIPVEEVLDRLERYPGSGHYWSGGASGDWQEGKNPHP